MSRYIFNGRFTVSAISRLMMLVFSWVLCFLIASIIVAVIGRNGMDTGRLRIAMVIQDVVGFIMPAILTAVVVTRQSADFLMLRNVPSLKDIILVAFIVIASAPVMNLIIQWNESLTLPDSMTEISQWMRTSEEAAQESIKMLIGGGNISSLIATLLIVAIMAGLSEEIFFRGGLQRVLVTFPINHHLAIWITAFIFSAIHLQFFGFFPRLLLGAFFGYLAVWSGSLWLPILAHIANNAIAATAMWHSAATNTESAVNTIGLSESGPQWFLIIPLTLAAIVLIYILRRHLKTH